MTVLVWMCPLVDPRAPEEGYGGRGQVQAAGTPGLGVCLDSLLAALIGDARARTLTLVVVVGVVATTVRVRADRPQQLQQELDRGAG